VRLAVPGGTALRVPVFWRRRDTLVLPAFGRLTGGQPVRPAAGDQLLVAGAERVRALPPATS
jgi:metallophosphoesterase superfamily enzyme